MAIHVGVSGPLNRASRPPSQSSEVTIVPISSRLPSGAQAWARAALHGLLPLALGLLASTALAEATVVVELKRPDGSSAEGTVVLSAQGKREEKYRCSTDKAGRCALPGVVGGMYTVSVEQPGKPAPKEKTVVIPPTGEVKLIVNAN
jgi:hypothetical protein